MLTRKICTSLLSLGIALTSLTAETSAPPSRIDAYKDWTSALAIQAASWASPLVIMYALRAHDAFGPHAKSPPNKIWRMEDISTPALSKEAGYVTPNVNVIYGFGFMDLSLEPIVVSAPDSNNRYYMVEIVDMWTNAFAYIGGKATGYSGGQFLLTPPDWSGEVPEGLQRISCPTPWVLLQPRVHIYKEGKVDVEGAKKILQEITAVGLSEYLGHSPLHYTAYNYPMPVTIDSDQPVSALDFKDPLQFWEILMVAMNENPPPSDQVNALVPMFSPLGIEMGEKWERAKLSKELLEVMENAAANIGELLNNQVVGRIYNGAFIPSPTIGDSGTDYRTRAIVARVGLTANTPYESVYWMYSLDKNNQELSGANKYTMTFKEEIPYYAPGFWSITMYDASNNYTVENPIDRYMIGSDSHDLKKNRDGSFTIYIQHEHPGKDKESNWLPAPKGGFYLIPRAYAPKPQTIRILQDPTSWPVPTVDSDS